MKDVDARVAVRTAWHESSRMAIVSLVVANLVPLAAVLSGRWSLFSVMFLYWAENAVIGGYNVLKILLAQGGGRPAHWLARVPLAFFFAMHYGIFWFVHGVFVFVLFGGQGMRGLNLSRSVQITPDLWSVLGLLILSHGISFTNNFIGRREFMTVTPQEQMMQPYTRVVILHVVVLVGGFLVMLLGQPLPALVLLVVLKTGFDLNAHLREHGRIERAQQVRPTIERE